MTVTFVYISTVRSTWLWTVLWGPCSHDVTIWQECFSFIRLSWEHHCGCSTLLTRIHYVAHSRMYTPPSPLHCVLPVAAQSCWKCVHTVKQHWWLLRCCCRLWQWSSWFCLFLLELSGEAHPVWGGAAVTPWIRHVVCDGRLWACVVSLAAPLSPF